VSLTTDDRSCLLVDYAPAWLTVLPTIANFISASFFLAWLIVVKKRTEWGLPSTLFFWEKRLRNGCHSSEADEWSKGRTQIVMCASGEVDLIAGLKAQTDRADMSFQTGPGVKRTADVVRS
jgi:hypothetical protein